jgi:hypothetical protein
LTQFGDDFFDFGSCVFEVFDYNLMTFLDVKKNKPLSYPMMNPADKPEKIKTGTRFPGFLSFLFV